MLRKFLLISMAFVATYSLTALAGYVLYAVSASMNDAQLSVIVLTIFNPLIAVLVGAMVGFLSKDNPIQTALVGLAPWAILLVGPRKPISLSGWIISLSPLFVLLPLGAAAAAFVWRGRHRAATTRVTP